MASLVDVPSDATVNLAFQDGQAHGTSACNSYSGGYRAGTDGSLAFDAFALTMMACDESRMALESAYLDALSGVTTFSLGDTLQLTGSGVSLTYARAASPEALPLAGTPWKLTTIAGGQAVSSVVANTEVTMELQQSDSSVSGSAGCNRYSGTYTDGGGGALSFSPLATTRMACADDVMAQEATFLAAMQQVATFSIDETQLQLFDGSGALLLVFAG